MPRPLAALLDYGGVMATSPVGRLHWLADELGCGREVVVATIFGDPNDHDDNPWHDAEVGRCALDAGFGDRMAVRFARHGVDFDLEMFVEWVAGAINDPQPEIVDAVAVLRRAGIRTALVTNSVREFRPVIEQTIDVPALFDLVVDSSEVGLRKPDPAIFVLAADRLGVEPDRCVFVDDLPGHVEAARDVGMTAVHLDGNADEVARSLLAMFGLAD